MKVVLVDVTKDGIDKIARMGRSTRLNDIPEKWDAKWGTQEKFVKSLMSVEHLGILEHITFTFHVSEISRNLTHQLVRHRLASYLQQSNRRVIPNIGNFIIPPTIKEDKEKEKHFVHFMNEAWRHYMFFIDDFKIPIEDARYLLPSGYFTHISITMNARQLRHFFSLRLDKTAQWEIRKLACKMYDIAYEKYQIIFEDLKELRDKAGEELGI